MRGFFRLCALGLLTVSGATWAEEATEYSTHGAWTIAIDNTLDNGCFVSATYAGSAALRIGFDPSSDSFYALFADDDWRSIEYGKSYTVEVVFGDESPWRGDATGFSFNPPNNEGVLELVVSQEASELFLLEFMQEQNVVVRYKNKDIMNLNLSDSFRSGLELLECQKAMDKFTADPFDEITAPSSNDPFASSLCPDGFDDAISEHRCEQVKAASYEW